MFDLIRDFFVGGGIAWFLIGAIVGGIAIVRTSQHYEWFGFRR